MSNPAPCDEVTSTNRLGKTWTRRIEKAVFLRKVESRRRCKLKHLGTSWDVVLLQHKDSNKEKPQTLHAGLFAEELVKDAKAVMEEVKRMKKESKLKKKFLKLENKRKNLGSLRRGM